MKAPTERLLLLPRCASSSDTVREIKYQILHSYDATRLSDNVRQIECWFSQTIRDVIVSRPWQAHREHRPLARLARHGHVTAHHARELAADPDSNFRPRGWPGVLSGLIDQRIGAGK